MSTLIEKADSGRWDKIINHVYQQTSYEDIIKEKHPVTHKTLLHYACGQTKKRASAADAGALLYVIQDLQIRKNYVNKPDINGTTALHVAATCENRHLVKFLIDEGADVNIVSRCPEIKEKLRNKNAKADGITLIYQYMPDVLISLFYERISIREDEDDSHKNFWVVECDFSCITGMRGRAEGSRENVLIREMPLLARGLREQRHTVSGVHLHPLVQIFLHYKGEKFKWLIYTSMGFHIIWSLMCTIHIAHNFPFNSKTVPNQSWAISALWIIFNIAFVLMYLANLIKEFVEVILEYPNWLFYWKQSENWGQWVLLLGIFINCFIALSVTLHNPDAEFIANIISATGIFCSLLLILGQLNKVKWLGIYVEMLVTVMKSVFMFLVTFSPIFAAYVVTFSHLMPNMDQFSLLPPWGFIKILAMMTGELNYDDLFYSDKSPKNVPFSVITKILFTTFIILVTIILQNLLIGVTISDIQDLRSRAKESHLATQLEQIYLLEKFLLLECIQRRPGYKQKLEKYLISQRSPVNQDNQDAENTLEEKIQFRKLPKSLKKMILENVQAGKLGVVRPK